MTAEVVESAELREFAVDSARKRHMSQELQCQD